MKVRIVTLELKPGRVDEAVSFFWSNIAPVTREQKGCKGITLLVDRENCKVTSLVKWETDEDMLANENNGYLQEQLRKSIRVVAARPIIDYYDIDGEQSL